MRTHPQHPHPPAAKATPTDATPLFSPAFRYRLVFRDKNDKEEKHEYKKVKHATQPLNSIAPASFKVNRIVFAQHSPAAPNRYEKNNNKNKRKPDILSVDVPLEYKIIIDA